MQLKSHIPQRPPGPREVFLLPLGFVAVAWMARWALSPLMGDEAPYLFFIAAMLASTFYGALIGGAISAAAAGLLANPGFNPADLSGEDIWALAVFWGFSAVLVLGEEALICAVRKEMAQNAQFALVQGELKHRLRNMLAVTEAISQQTGRSAVSVADFQDRLGARLRALGSAQDLISTDATAAPVTLSAVISHALEPFMTDGRLRVTGSDELHIERDLVTPLALVLNELATNATKYGALSAPAGRVSLSCVGEGRHVRLEWTETQGPRVSAPSRHGFGASLMRAAIPRSRGKVEVSFDPRGLRCQVVLNAPPQRLAEPTELKQPRPRPLRREPAAAGD